MLDYWVYAGSGWFGISLFISLAILAFNAGGFILFFFFFEQKHNWIAIMVYLEVPILVILILLYELRMCEINGDEAHTIRITTSILTLLNMVLEFIPYAISLSIFDCLDVSLPDHFWIICDVSGITFLTLLLLAFLSYFMKKVLNLKEKRCLTEKNLTMLMIFLLYMSLILAKTGITNLAIYILLEKLDIH